MTHNFWFTCASQYILKSQKTSLLAMIALSAVQSSAQTFIHNVILFNDTSDSAWYNQIHWLVGMPYWSIIASDVLLENSWIPRLMSGTHWIEYELTF